METNNSPTGRRAATSPLPRCPGSACPRAPEQAQRRRRERMAFSRDLARWGLFVSSGCRCFETTCAETIGQVFLLSGLSSSIQRSRCFRCMRCVSYVVHLRVDQVLPRWLWCQQHPHKLHAVCGVYVDLLPRATAVVGSNFAPATPRSANERVLVDFDLMF